GLALKASAGSQKQADAMRRNRDARERRERESAQALAAQFEGRTITIKARAGGEGRLFGSVTSTDIAEAVQKQTGAEIDRRKLALEEPLKELGGVDVQVRLHHDVVATVHVEVEAAGGSSVVGAVGPWCGGARPPASHTW